MAMYVEFAVSDRFVKMLTSAPHSGSHSNPEESEHDKYEV